MSNFIKGVFVVLILIIAYSIDGYIGGGGLNDPMMGDNLSVDDCNNLTEMGYDMPECKD